MYDFSNYKTFKELFRYLYYKKMSVNDAEMEQSEFDAKLNALNKYSPKGEKYFKTKNKLLNNAENFYKGIKKIIEGFKKGIFLLKSDGEFEQQTSEESGAAAFNEGVKIKEADINNELLKYFFTFEKLNKIESPSDMLQYLYMAKDRKENTNLVKSLNKALKDLEEEIVNMSDEEKKSKKPEKIVEIVKEILNFNEQIQIGKGLKIITPSQMLSRLPTSLAQLQAGNNSEKLKNEIRQLLYSLYRSKNMTKQVYNNLIKYI